METMAWEWRSHYRAMKASHRASKRKVELSQKAIAELGNTESTFDESFVPHATQPRQALHQTGISAPMEWLFKNGDINII